MFFFLFNKEKEADSGLRFVFAILVGALGRIRTYNQRIMSPLLYR